MVIQTLLFAFVLTSIISTPAMAKKSYVVYLGGHTDQTEDIPSRVARVDRSHCELLASVLGSTERAYDSIFASQYSNINAFGAVLDEEEAKTLARHPSVVSVFINTKRELLTTHSYAYLGLEDDHGVVPSYSAWKQGRFGEDAIIANLDSGIWPEAPSFNDESMGPIPSRWKGICQNVTCNRKLIGARYFIHIDGIKKDPFNSPYDKIGHGTTTLSIAGGTFVPGVSVYNFSMGTAKGGSPISRVAVYKVCEDYCYDVDILNGFDAAISDGVDIISVSFGSNGPTKAANISETSIKNLEDDSVAIGAFHAMEHGILVVCGGGNDGNKGYGFVINTAPWVITVASSTTNRDFYSEVVLGNNEVLKGKSLPTKSLPPGKFYPVITGTDGKAANSSLADAKRCMPGSLDPMKVSGKILVCLMDKTDDVNTVAAQAGAVGMILAKNAVFGQDIYPTEDNVIPTSHISYVDGITVFSYIKSTTFPTARITKVKVEFNVEPAPVMASSSSKGPNPVISRILKPDITAPGVRILNVYMPKKRWHNGVKEGTSLSAPHIAGIAGLLKTVYPEWSPAAIRSAIMTTARTQDHNGGPILESSHAVATPFNYGAGEVSANKALDPGLVYDISAEDYVDFLCSMGYNKTQLKKITNKTTCSRFNPNDFNYPSITIPDLSGTVVFQRRLKNVGAPGIYNVTVEEPQGVLVSVDPMTLCFKRRGQEKTFKVTLKAVELGTLPEYAFGSLTWCDGNHFVRSPIVVKEV